MEMMSRKRPPWIRMDKMGRAMDCYEAVDVNRVILCMHGLVTYGPSDLHISLAMSRVGYDAVKWAEGQCLLAQLVTSERPLATHVAQALRWYEEAAGAARQVLSDSLLAKVGLGARRTE